MMVCLVDRIARGGSVLCSRRNGMRAKDSMVGGKDESSLGGGGGCRNVKSLDEPTVMSRYVSKSLLERDIKELHKVTTYDASVDGNR